MLKFLGRMLKPYKKLVILVLLLQIASNCLSLYLPTINAGILNYGVPNLDMSYIATQGIIMIVLSLLQVACSVLASTYGAKASLSSGRDLREGMYAKILSLSQREIALFGAPTLITRTTNDIQQITQFITYLFTIIISAPIMFVGGIVMAATLDLPLSTVIFCMLPVFAIVSVWFIKRIIPYYRQQQERIDEANAVLRDQISGVRVVKAFVKEECEKDRMGVVNGKLMNLNAATGRTTSIMTPLFLFIVNIASIVIMWYGGTRAEVGQTQVGTIVSMVTYASYILSAVMLASMVFILLPRADVSVKRVAQVLATSSSIKEKEDSAADITKGEVVFDNVSFSYVPENKDVTPVLRQLSFTAKPGQTTAVIGSTGCGKTTLLNLIIRLMDVTEGSVKIDGTDVRDMRVEKLEKSIGLVPQKAFLFSGTLEENLRHANKEATDEELWEALRVAQADDFVRADESGLKKHVSEGGTNFSGGQKQRLAIARAIVRRPFIYIFDDSFSALDYSTDKKLRTALKEITKDATVIIVAQRISSIVDADQIIVMNNGRIDDIGTHDELLARCAVYQEIAASQPTGETEGAV